MKLKKWIILGTATGLFLLAFYFILPDPLFSDPLSTVVYDRNGELLGARIASDGQWRFPGVDSVPEKYASALVLYEDHYFYYHPGINPVSILRALKQNIKAGEIVSGGSTITMQVMRMSRKNKDRTILQKIIESTLAVRLECAARKKDILKLYADNAPFGGNVVGIEAASWRYFGRDPQELTWAESALLAVLPNAPSLIHPGRNRNLLEEKRNRLLEKLMEKRYLDSLSYKLAIEEPLPENPLPLPNLAPHLTDKMMLEPETPRFHSTIDKNIQERVNELVSIRQEQLRSNEIHNMACMVMEVQYGEVLAYVGNSSAQDGKMHGSDVDVIPARRSTGSILKPFLFAGMLDNGDILQTSMVPDVPIRYNGYAPKNYDRSYQGAVRAYEALERSLNIPSVILLKRYGVDPFLSLLKQLGFSTFDFSSDHYGLTLILGGAESSLWELAGVYGSLARVLNNYPATEGKYFNSDYHMPLLERRHENVSEERGQEEGLLSASSIYLMFNSLLEVNRPIELSLWYLLSSSRKIAWKTGTSYGFRDAWAIGVTPEYVVAVWAGNADGEGRPGLSGVQSAAPLLFDVFSLLPETSWFEAPLDDLREGVVCKKSGYLAGPYCDEIDTIDIVPKGGKSVVCPYHLRIHLDSTETFRVNSRCYPVRSMKAKNWFVLPPLMEWYYKRSNPTYAQLPELKEGCVDETVRAMEIVYPEQGSHLVIPRELDGSKGKVVMEVSHRKPASTVYWHIDDAYLDKTNSIHKLAVDIAPGVHQLTVVDENGNTESVRFEVLK